MDLGDTSAGRDGLAAREQAGRPAVGRGMTEPEPDKPMDPAVEVLARALVALDVDSHPTPRPLHECLRECLRANDHWEAEAKRLESRLAIFEAYRGDMSGHGQGQLTELIARAAKTKLENGLSASEAKS